MCINPFQLVAGTTIFTALYLVIIDQIQVKNQKVLRDIGSYSSNDWERDSKISFHREEVR